MTLDDDLTRTVALLGDGYRITAIARAKRAQERTEMLTADRRTEARADIARLDLAAEDRDAAEVVLYADQLRALARGATVEIHIHDPRLARALARVDGARVNEFPANEFRAAPFRTVTLPGVCAFTGEVLP